MIVSAVRRVGIPSEQCQFFPLTKSETPGDKTKRHRETRQEISPVVDIKISPPILPFQSTRLVRRELFSKGRIYVKMS